MLFPITDIIASSYMIKTNNNKLCNSNYDKVRKKEDMLTMCLITFNI